MDHIFKYITILNDTDPTFTSIFYKELSLSLVGVCKLTDYRLPNRDRTEINRLPT
jgi:hypothetical protein